MGYRLKFKEISEKLLLQNQRVPNPEGSKFFQVRRGPNPEGSCFHKTRGVPIRRGLKFANSKRSQTGGVSILPIRRVLFLPIRRDINFFICQPGGVLFY